jgi:hypothetical protein
VSTVKITSEAIFYYHQAINVTFMRFFITALVAQSAVGLKGQADKISTAINKLMENTAFKRLFHNLVDTKLESVISANNLKCKKG